MIFGGFLWCPLNHVKIFVSQISTDIKKKTIALALAVQKIDCLGPHFFWFLGEVAQKISGDKIGFAALQLGTKLDFDVLRFRRIAYKI